MAIVNFKNRQGTVLLEAIIAIGVILVGVVGSLVLLNTSINLGRANQDKIVGQNLAREGMELAYALRNSGSLRHVDNSTTTWSSYLLSSALKASDEATFNKNYNLGEVIDSGECRQRCSSVQTTNDPSHCVNAAESNDNGIMFGTGASTPSGLTADQARDCDIEALRGYLYTGTFPYAPKACMDAVGDIPDHRTEIGTTGPVVDCNFDGESGSGIDIADLAYLIDALYLQSYQLSNAYPTISFGTVPDGQFTFYNPISAANFDSSPTSSTYGKYTNFQAVWDNANAQVHTLNNAYVQPTVSGAQPTKFYRVVSLQPICRGSGPATEFVIPQDYALNCADYQAKVGFSSSAKVGVLVSSEVRWPTPTSPTKVKYQEFLYDWIYL